MSKSPIHFNDYVSLAVMLLMVVALVAGQAGASTYAAASKGPIAPIVVMDDRIMFDFDGHIGDQAMKLSIAVVTDLSHFRGEDE
jgi:hypothetical protein